MGKNKQLTQEKISQIIALKKSGKETNEIVSQLVVIERSVCAGLLSFTSLVVRKYQRMNEGQDLRKRRMTGAETL